MCQVSKKKFRTEYEHLGRVKVDKAPGGLARKAHSRDSQLRGPFKRQLQQRRRRRRWRSAAAARREEQCRASVEAANVPVAEVQAAVDVVHCYTVRAEVAPAKV